MRVNFFDALRMNSLLAAGAAQCGARSSKPAVSRAGVRYISAFDVAHCERGGRCQIQTRFSIAKIITDFNKFDQLLYSFGLPPTTISSAIHEVPNHSPYLPNTTQVKNTSAQHIMNDKLIRAPPNSFAQHAHSLSSALAQPF